MEQIKNLTLLLLMALLVGVGFSVGCAAGPEAPPAPVMDAADAMRQAELAFQEEDYARARALYQALEENADELSNEQLELVTTQLARLDSIDHEARIAPEGAEMAQAEMAEHPAPEAPAEEAAPAAEEEAAEAPAEPAEPEVDVAEQAERMVAEAERLIEAQTQARALAERAALALEQQDFERAQALYTQTLERLNEPDLAAVPSMVALAAHVQEQLGLLEQRFAEQERLARVQSELQQMVAEAARLAESDLLAAEVQALRAQQYAQRQGVPPTPEQQQTLRGVMRAVEAEYGAIREARQDLYVWARAFVDQYQSAGEYGKAAQLYALLESAPPDMVQDSVKQWASDKYLTLKQAAEEQVRQARQLAEVFADARQAVAKNLQHGLATRQEIIRAANEADLSTDQAAAIFLEADLDFLTTAVPEALAAAEEQVTAMIGEMLPRAVDRARAAVTTPPPLDLERESEQLFELAKRLHELAAEGDLQEAAEVRRQIDDLKVQMAARQASRALAAGEYAEARELLAQAPADAASARARETILEPARARLETVAAAEAALDAAQLALASHQMQQAAEHLNQVDDVGSLPAAVQARVKALSGVLESVREARAAVEALRAENQRAIEQAHRQLEQVRRRMASWDAYHAALQETLQTEPEQALEALGNAMSHGEGLMPFEKENLNALASVLSEADEKALAMAQDMLREAADLFARRDYVGAARVLAEVEKTGAYKTSAEVRERAQSLAQQIEQKEHEARRLYAQAVDAYEAGNPERVRELMLELKAGYKQTQAYMSASK